MEHQLVLDEQTKNHNIFDRLPCTCQLHLSPQPGKIHDFIFIIKGMVEQCKDDRGKLEVDLSNSKIMTYFCHFLRQTFIKIKHGNQEFYDGILISGYVTAWS